ncbi:hypothetical protein MLD38_035692 [Melastoma candidum]|uniref:Uncharacterized protein n=1 Tax=Melastoma candidum TaxID=119954 RepID=A0ACB9LHW7_9MYRT|nr:hypothetical protein MLD38_035692 [Melastoma candidum]
MMMEKQKSFKGLLEKQKSFKGLLEKQRSFKISMERQLSFVDPKSGTILRSSATPRESPGKRGDSSLHSAARSGNLARVRDVLGGFEEGGVDRKGEIMGLLCRQNTEGETPLYAAAENGHVAVVSEILKSCDIESASIATRNGYDPFHVAAKQGHLGVVKELLRVFPNLAMTADATCTTALHTAATQGHTEIVNLLLETDSNLAKIARNNGKTVLHSTARMGHVEVVKALLRKDPSAGFRTDKKGQTALHMAVKGLNEEIVRELIKSDPSILSVEENKGNTALHIATKKGRSQIVRCLLSLEGIDINAINKAGETPLDIANSFSTPELASILKEAGALSSKEKGKPPTTAKQLKQTVSDIKHEVQSQLHQTRQTGIKVQKIAKRVKNLHISGLNNAISSATVVAVLIATVAFAAIFTVPGQYVQTDTKGMSLGEANVSGTAAFIIFFFSDSSALFISLAVVVVQTSVVVIEEKAKRQLVFVINKLMWLACLFISVAFISLSYIVVGPQEQGLAICATAIGGTIMLTTIGSMCYCVIMHRLEEKRLRNIRRGGDSHQSRSYSMSMASEPDILGGSNKRMYAV